MSWFHQLCCDVEGQNSEKTWLIISKGVETGLSDDEQIEVMSMHNGSQAVSLRDKNEYFMMKLRELCEKKQRKHVHGQTETREHYVKERSSSIDVFRRNLSSSIEALLKVAINF